jgi:hypothetical protein
MRLLSRQTAFHHHTDFHHHETQTSQNIDEKSKLLYLPAHTMVKVIQSSIPLPWVGVSLKTQQISEVDGLGPPT